MGMACPGAAVPTGMKVFAVKTTIPRVENDLMKILVVDVGGTHVKLLATGQHTGLKIDSGPDLTPDVMVAAVKRSTTEWAYDVVAMGYPGPVKDGRPAAEPHNLGPGWVDFDFEAAFGKPVKILNDAAMQALGSYRGGRMLYLGLGTGLGSAFIVDGVLAPLELAHLPYTKSRTYEDVVGLRGLERLGKKKWRLRVQDVVERFKQAFVVEDVVLGGGNTKKLDELPAGARRCENANAFVGGFRLWGKTVGAERTDDGELSLTELEHVELHAASLA
jgi:polyphosphate glucokinase